MTKSVLKLITAITTGLMLFYFAVPAGAWSQYGECCYWDGEEFHYIDALCSGCCKCGGDCDCMHDHSKCPPCHFCIDCGCENYCDPNEVCCDWLCCDEDLCETCVGGDECKVCGGDTSKCCDNGTCVDKCTDNAATCEWDYPDDYLFNCENFHPTDKSCEAIVLGQICSHRIIYRGGTAKCADCAPNCAKIYVEPCAVIYPIRCKNVRVLLFLYCQCQDEDDTPRYSGSAYDCAN